MALFEFDEGRLIPAQFGRPLSHGIEPEILDCIRSQVLEVVARPLFPVSWQESFLQDCEDAPCLTALDPSGEVVSIKVLGRLDSDGLVTALAQMNQNNSLGWLELASAFPGGAEAFRANWAQFRESMPPKSGPGPHLILVVAAICDEVRSALGALAPSGLEVHEVSVREMTNGRRFLDVQLVSDRGQSRPSELISGLGGATSEVPDAITERPLPTLPVATPLTDLSAEPGSAPEDGPQSDPTAEPQDSNNQNANNIDTAAPFASDSNISEAQASSTNTPAEPAYQSVFTDQAWASVSPPEQYQLPQARTSSVDNDQSGNHAPETALESTPEPGTVPANESFTTPPDADTTNEPAHDDPAQAIHTDDPWERLNIQPLGHAQSPTPSWPTLNTPASAAQTAPSDPVEADSAPLASAADFAYPPESPHPDATSDIRTSTAPSSTEHAAHSHLAAPIHSAADTDQQSVDHGFESLAENGDNLQLQLGLDAIVAVLGQSVPLLGHSDNSIREALLNEDGTISCADGSLTDDPDQAWHRAGGSGSGWRQWHMGLIDGPTLEEAIAEIATEIERENSRHHRA